MFHCYSSSCLVTNANEWNLIVKRNRLKVIFRIIGPFFPPSSQRQKVAPEFTVLKGLLRDVVKIVPLKLQFVK